MAQRLAAPLIGALLGVLAAAGGILTSVHNRTDPLWMWVPMQAVGVSFVAAGTTAWLRRPDNGTGRLMTAVGVCWYLLDLRYSPHPVLFALGFAGFYLSPVIFTHLVLALPDGHLTERRERLVAAGLYATVLVTQPMRLLAEHPRGPRGWTVPVPAQSLWAPAGSVLGLGLTLAALVLVLRRWRTAGRPARRRHALVWVTGAAVGLVVLVTILASLLNAAETVHRLLAVTYIAGLVFTPFAILTGLLRVRMARLRVADLVMRLEATPEPRQLGRALADALGDPTLQVCFKLPGDHDEYVDADGHPVALPAADHRVVTPVRRRGEQLAVLVHDPTLTEQRSLVDSVAAAAGLALDNARLHAAQRAQLAEVRASRARIVASADAERHRLQRDLHDGAQPRLLAIAMLVGRARAHLPSTEPASVAELLAKVATGLHEVIRSLRELTEGIDPPALTEQGLAAVVESLAERAPLPVVSSVPQRRWPDQVERAAYFLINEALANVYKHASATHTTVRVAEHDGVLTVQVSDDGVGGADPGRGSGLRGLHDRVAAVGGALHVHSPPGEGTIIVTELPCGS